MPLCDRRTSGVAMLRDVMMDWSFWAVVIAALAVALSQSPPIRLWFKRPRLDIELYSRIALTHKLGNPNAQIHIIISNVGGRTVRIRSLRLKFTRNGEHTFELPAQSYLQAPTDKDSVLFTPFSLNPGAEWSHIANCLNFFGRDDEKRYRDMESNLRQEIVAKRQQAPDTLVEADVQYVQPLLEFFDRKFNWLPGEYELEVAVQGNSVQANGNYTFTIFESESNELRTQTEGYKYGAGVYWEPTGGYPRYIFVLLHERVT